MTDNLLIVKRIRNAFAHTKKVMDFSDELVTAELKKIKASPKSSADFARELKVVQGVIETPEAAYTGLCFALCKEILRHLGTLLESRAEAAEELTAMMEEIIKSGSFDKSTLDRFEEVAKVLRAGYEEETAK